MSEGKNTNQVDSSDPLTSMEDLNAAMISHARQIARKIGASAVLVYVDVIKSREQLTALLKERRCILAARYQGGIDDLESMEGVEERVIRVPYMNLTRQIQVKVAAMLALSQGLIKHGDRIVCLTGSPKYEIFDSLTVLDVGREFEIFSSKDLGIIGKMDNPHVFDRLLTLSLELAEEGKEGKPLGTIFILGDDQKVMELSAQMVMNPFPVSRKPNATLWTPG